MLEVQTLKLTVGEMFTPDAPEVEKGEPTATFLSALEGTDTMMKYLVVW